MSVCRSVLQSLGRHVCLPGKMYGHVRVPKLYAQVLRMMIGAKRAFIHATVRYDTYVSVQIHMR